MDEQATPYTALQPIKVGVAFENDISIRHFDLIGGERLFCLGIHFGGPQNLDVGGLLGIIGDLRAQRNKVRNTVPMEPTID